MYESFSQHNFTWIEGWFVQVFEENEERIRSYLQLLSSDFYSAKRVLSVHRHIHASGLQEMRLDLQAQRIVTRSWHLLVVRHIRAQLQHTGRRTAIPA